MDLSPAYVPVLIKGLRIHPENPLRFDFLIDTGHSGLKSDAPGLRRESEKLIKYFLASLTIPEKDLWVNLSPYENDRIITPGLDQTQLGQDMLAQDYLLKQVAASLIYPEKELGKKFWDRVYAKISPSETAALPPVNVFNKVWIVPDEAGIFVRNSTAYVLEGHLKVMLEQDYLAAQKNIKVARSPKGTATAPIIREIIIPELEKEINTGKNFIALRQMFHSLILATWYKKHLKEALLNQVYADQGKTSGIGGTDTRMNERIYEQYLAAYKRGVFNYIKDEGPAAKTGPRKYFSGGLLFQVTPRNIENPSQAMLAPEGSVVLVEARMGKLDAAMNDSGDPLSNNTAMTSTEFLTVQEEMKGVSALVYANFHKYLSGEMDAQTLERAKRLFEQYDQLVEREEHAVDAKGDFMGEIRTVHLVESWQLVLMDLTKIVANIRSKKAERFLAVLKKSVLIAEDNIRRFRNRIMDIAEANAPTGLASRHNYWEAAGLKEKQAKRNIPELFARELQTAIRSAYSNIRAYENVTDQERKDGFKSHIRDRRDFISERFSEMKSSQLPREQERFLRGEVRKVLKKIEAIVPLDAAMNGKLPRLDKQGLRDLADLNGTFMELLMGGCSLETAADVVTRTPALETVRDGVIQKAKLFKASTETKMSRWLNSPTDMDTVELWEWLSDWFDLLREFKDLYAAIQGELNRPEPALTDAVTAITGFLDRYDLKRPDKAMMEEEFVQPDELSAGLTKMRKLIEDLRAQARRLRELNSGYNFRIIEADLLTASQRLATQIPLVHRQASNNSDDVVELRRLWNLGSVSAERMDNWHWHVEVALLLKERNRLNPASVEILQNILAGLDQLLTHRNYSVLTPWENSTAQNTDEGLTAEGGIDFNTQHMRLDESGEDLRVDLDHAMIEQFKVGHFTGVQPEILKVSPIPSVLPLLGLSSSSSGES